MTDTTTAANRLAGIRRDLGTMTKALKDILTRLPLDVREPLGQAIFKLDIADSYVEDALLSIEGEPV